MDMILIISILISFFITLAALPKWIKKSKDVGLLWEDMNKLGHPKNVASSGGIVVVMAEPYIIIDFTSLILFKI